MSEAPVKKSGGALKWILIGCGGLALLAVVAIGVLVFVVIRGFTRDPAEVEKIAHRILPFELPEGVSGRVGMSTFGVEMAHLESEDGISISLVSVPGRPEGVEMETRLDDLLGEQGVERQVVEERQDETFTVRGQEVRSRVAITAETDGGNRAIQYSFTLEGDEGEAILVNMAGPEGKLDPSAVQSILDTVQ